VVTTVVLAIRLLKKKKLSDRIEPRRRSAQDDAAAALGGALRLEAVAGGGRVVVAHELVGSRLLDGVASGRRFFPHCVLLDSCGFAVCAFTGRCILITSIVSAQTTCNAYYIKKRLCWSRIFVYTKKKVFVWVYGHLYLC